jgi:hypothetical protein
LRNPKNLVCARAPIGNEFPKNRRCVNAEQGHADGVELFDRDEIEERARRVAARGAITKSTMLTKKS